MQTFLHLFFTFFLTTLPNSSLSPLSLSSTFFPFFLSTLYPLSVRRRKGIFLFAPILIFFKFYSKILIFYTSLCSKIAIRIKWKFCQQAPFYIFLLYWPPTPYRLCVIWPKEQYFVTFINVVKIFSFLMAASTNSSKRSSE